VPRKRSPDAGTAARPPGASIRPDELEGFRDGLAHRAERHRREGRSVDRAETELRRAADALAHRRWADAEAALLAADDLLDALEPEMDLRERPRGFVDYRPRDGDPGVPPERDEEPIANRLLLVQRLLGLRRAQGVPVDDVVRTLREAEVAYARGDRELSRRAIDRAHRLLDERDPDAVRRMGERSRPFEEVGDRP
jgi:hypothetical protein